jgi:polysaccharide export outer membrane protein
VEYNKVNKCVFIVLILLVLTGCAELPHAGPSTSDINAASMDKELRGIKIVTVNYAIAYALHKINVSHHALITGFPKPQKRYHVAPGDTLQIYSWEVASDPLFSGGSAHGQSSTSTMTAFPKQMVNANGTIFIPFIGYVSCDHKSTEQIAKEIQTKLVGKANDPQIQVSMDHNRAQNISVFGRVVHTIQVPWAPGGINILQALAAAGGVTKPLGSVIIEISNNSMVTRIPLREIVRYKADNFLLPPGSVLSAIYRPMKVTLMGSGIKNAEIHFNDTTVPLSRVLASGGGIKGSKADSRGVFVFRFEKPRVLKNITNPAHILPDGLVPVIFRFNFSKPGTLFAAQKFPVQNGDIVYVASSPISDLQKFLGIVIQLVYPIQGLTTAGIVP